MQDGGLYGQVPRLSLIRPRLSHFSGRDSIASLLDEHVVVSPAVVRRADQDVVCAAAMQFGRALRYTAAELPKADVQKSSAQRQRAPASKSLDEIMALAEEDEQLSDAEMLTSIVERLRMDDNPSLQAAPKRRSLI